MGKWNNLAVLAALLALPALLASAAGSKEGAKATAARESDQALEISWVGNPTANMYPEETAYIAQELDKRFHVKLMPVKANSNKPEEMNRLFASGEIPDHILVAQADLARFTQEGLFRQIPEAMLKEVAPTYHERILDNHPSIMKSAYYKKGGFLALPEGRGEMFPLTAIRTDWLEKVGATMPADLSDYEEICRLFAQKDPDGNGKPDTWGSTIATYYDIYNLAAVFGFSLAHGTVKDDSYIPGADGRLIKAAVSPQYRNLLKYCANLYKKGYIYPNVAVSGKESDSLFTDGNVGIKTYDTTYFIPKYRPGDWFALTFRKNPNARAAYMSPLKGPGGEEAVYEKQSNVWRYLCIGKNTSDAKLKKILEIQQAQLADMTVHNLIWRGTEGVHYSVDEDGMAILKKEWSSNEKQAELGVKFFISNLRYGEQLSLSFGREADVQNRHQSAYKTVNQAIPGGTVVKCAVEYGADVKKLEQEFFLNVVAGTWSADTDWDAYVKRCAAAGGDKITAEVNEIYRKMQ